MRCADKYGTILINLQTHRPLDLLPDRTSSAVFPWLKNHPEIEVVSRDRASSYADAVKHALPDATQVADRYHLVQNLREHVQRLLERKRTCLPLVEDTFLTTPKAGTTESLGMPCDLPPGENLVATPERAKVERPDQPLTPAQPEQPGAQMEQEAELSSLSYAERKKKISRDKRYARYEEVMALHRAGRGLRAIARQLRISRKVVRRFVASPCFPERG